MSRSPAMSRKAIATKSLKEKWLSMVQSARENGENGIGGFSTVTEALNHRYHSFALPLRRFWRNKHRGEGHQRCQIASGLCQL